MANRNAAVGSDRTKGLIDARTGGKPKNVYVAPKVSPGMSHVTDDGAFARAVSKTESATILGNDSVGDVTYDGGQPKAGHLGQNVPIHPGMTSEQRMNATTESGPDVLREASLGLRGNAHLPESTNEIEDNGEPIRQPDCPATK